MCKYKYVSSVTKRFTSANKYNKTDGFFLHPLCPYAPLEVQQECILEGLKEQVVHVSDGEWYIAALYRICEVLVLKLSLYGLSG